MAKVFWGNISKKIIFNEKNSSLTAVNRREPID